MEKEQTINGRIIKGIAGFYYVHDGIDTVYECRAKGIFRNQKIKPMVGDSVTIQVLNQKAREGSLIQICQRKNQLIRPMVANVDQALILFASASPEPNLDLLDRLLISMELQDVPSVICFGKADLADEKTETGFREIYGKSGCPVFMISNYDGRGLDEVRTLLAGKTTVLAGPSGVGKSSLLNQIVPEANMETGTVSKKIQRGRHTTRHSELFYVEKNTYIMDTPGFSSLELMGIACDELKDCYREFDPYEGLCRFQGCAHIHEPDCCVKDAVKRGEISRRRYDSYCFLYNELKSIKKY